jgi:hypothetical protein
MLRDITNFTQCSSLAHHAWARRRWQQSRATTGSTPSIHIERENLCRCREGVIEPSSVSRDKSSREKLRVQNMWQPKIRLFTRERVSYEGTSRTRQATRCWGEIERKLTNTLVRTTYIRDIKIEREHASESLRVLSVNSDISGFREIVILTSSCDFFLMNN